jgi:hypothetical protein
VGKVTFSWEPVNGADSYLLQFTLPTGNMVTFATDEVTKDRYMEAFGMNGEFQWNVVAFDVSGKEICASMPSNFTKADKERNDDEGGEPACIVDCMAPPGGGGN